MKIRFVNAFVWLYGSTKRKAEMAYNRAMEIADYSYVREIIMCFEDTEM